MRFLLSWLFLFLILGHSNVLAQNEPLLQGVVQERSSNTPLPGANVYWEGFPQKGVVTDVYGAFALEAVKLPANLVISFIGYEQLVKGITEKDLAKFQTFSLRPEELSLQEIVISDKRPDENVRGLDMGRSSLPIETIKNIPALFGEVDILRSLQLLPGVQTAGEGTTGLFVRGGSADQNLVQLDGAPVYNPAHFFGFFSVFNPDALKGIEFYKGAIPANLGGRISSVLDISLKEGNYEKIKGEGGIGTISSRATVEGPLFSDKSSFVVSGRRTYADVFLGLSSDENIRNNDLYFYDISGKLSFKVGEKDKLNFSSYYGRDFLGVASQFGFGWKNQVTSLTWARNIRDNAFFDLNVYRSGYTYEVFFSEEEQGFDWDNRQSETGLKAEWTLLPQESSMFKWGFHSQYYHFSPISLRPAPGSAIDPIGTNPRNGIQNNVFISVAKEIGPKLKVEAGLRWGMYHQMGKGVQYRYNGETPAPGVQVLDTLSFGTGEQMAFYQGLEPRAALRYLINPNLSIKASYNRNYQYLQIASNSSAGLPIDRWLLAEKFVPPISGNQYSLGIFQNLSRGMWEVSLEGYYKDFNNVIDLRQGANVLFTDNVETEILSGIGYAYGAEFLVKKSIGKTNGWFAYTYSRTWRKIEGISNNQWYNPRFDRPHDLSLVINHEFNPKWSLGMTFVYTTGQAVSFPVGSYEVDNQRLPLYSDLRNQDRFPDYHRMDASVTYKNPHQGKKWRGSWNFSIYNLYGRKNPFSFQFTEIINGQINFDARAGEKIVSRRPGVVMTYLFTFLPAITYNFQF